MTHIPFQELSEIVGGSPKDALIYDCYQLTSHQLLALQPYFPTGMVNAGQFAPSTYDYYLEAECE